VYGHLLLQGAMSAAAVADAAGVADLLGEARHTAERLAPSRLAALPRERRATHLLDIARARSLGGRRDQAVRHLLEAAGLAAKEIRCRPVARNVITDLVRRSRTRPTLELQRLAWAWRPRSDRRSSPSWSWPPGWPPGCGRRDAGSAGNHSAEPPVAG
jgi:hypothetical protein